MIIQSAWQVVFSFFSKPVVVEPTETYLTTDAGLLPIRQFDERVGLTARFAAALDDPRQRECCEHTFAEMVRMRIYGILADYPDQNDHDTLNADPVFKLLAGRAPDAPDLASQPTLSRFENSINVRSLRRLQDVFIDQFIAAFAQPPRYLTLDMDPFDDPAYGDQQLTFWHDHYEQYQYLPRVITCAENDLVVMVCLLHGTAHAALGGADDLRYLVRRLRAVWPDVHLHFRGDAGLGVPSMYDASEASRIDYSIAVRMNPVLKKHSDALLKEVLRRSAETGQPQRDACGFWYQAGSWDHPRWCIVRAETSGAGSDRRAVLTNRPGAQLLPLAAYDEYADRGESENRNKELKCGLQADRLSDHRYMANLFRLYLHAAAYNLLALLRRQVADPPPPDPQAELPPEALAGKARRRYFNFRRQRDPLGEGHPCTWRSRLIKVAAEIIVRSRRIIVRLAGSWPYLHHYHDVAKTVLQIPPPLLLRPG